MYPESEKVKPRPPRVVRAFAGRSRAGRFASAYSAYGSRLNDGATRGSPVSG